MELNGKPVPDKADSPRGERRYGLQLLSTGGRKASMHLAHFNCAPALRHTQMDKAMSLPSRNPGLLRRLGVILKSERSLV